MPKFSELQNLPTAAVNDLIPILDVSETLPENVNKTIRVEDLLANAGGSSSPYLVTNLNGAVPTISAGITSFILGQESSIEDINSDSNGILGNNNHIKEGTKLSYILGETNDIYQDSDRSICLGTNNLVGRRIETVPTTEIVVRESRNSFVAGNTNFVMGGSNTAIGNLNKVYESTYFGIALGTSNTINFSQPITVNNYVEESITIGYSNTTVGSSNVLIGSYNSTETNSDFCTIIGPYNEIGENSSDSIAIGSSFVDANAAGSIAIGLYPYTKAPNSIAIGTGASCNNTTVASIAIGYGAAARAASSIVIGENSGVNINNNVNNIIVGSFSGISDNCNNSIVVGASSNLATGAINNISIGSQSQINNNSINSVILGHGALINNNLTNCVQLGTGTSSTSNTLQFLNTPIANATSIQASTQNTGVAPTSTPTNGSIIVDQSGNGRLYVRVNNTWKSVALA